MANTRFKRLTRFGLKSLLILMAVVAVWCGYYASQVRWRQQALALVAERGGLTWQRPPAATTDDSSLSRIANRYHELVYRLFGDVLRPDVTAIELTGVELSGDDLAALTALAELEWLSIGSSDMDDAAASELTGFPLLRWLDVSDTGISDSAVRKLSALKQLQWLDVSNTQIRRDELAALESRFPNAQIGLAFSHELYSLQSRETEVNSSDNAADASAASDAETLWQRVLQEPYATENLVAHLDAIGRSSAVSFPQWYISGVYEAERPDQDPLFVVQIYNGVQGSFNLGTMLVFESSGVLVRTMPGERVHFSLEIPMKQTDWFQSQSDLLDLRHQAVARGELLDLPDLNGDRYDDIPTQRWGDAWGALRGDGTAVYTTSRADVPCILRIGVPNSTSRGTLIDLTGMHVTLVYRDLENRKLTLETPCYSATPAGTSLLADLPRRTLATFVWSNEGSTFLGPEAGPNDTWRVLPP